MAEHGEEFHGDLGEYDVTIEPDPSGVNNERELALAEALRELGLRVFINDGNAHASSCCTVALGPAPHSEHPTYSLQLAEGPVATVPWINEHRAAFNIAFANDFIGPHSIARWTELVEQRTQFLGVDHPAVLRSRHNLASAFLFHERFAEAIDHFEPVLAAQESVLGPLHRDTIRTRIGLGAALLAGGDPERARTVRIRVINELAEVLGPDDPITLRTRIELLIDATSGVQQRSIEAATEILGRLEQVLDELHPTVLRSRRQVAEMRRQLLESDNALTAAQLVEPSTRKLFGKLHPESIAATRLLVFALHDSKRADEAIALGNSLLEETIATYGVDHPASLSLTATIGSACIDGGLSIQGFEVMEEAVAQLTTLWGRNHPRTLRAESLLIASYLRAERWGTATERLEDLATHRLATLGDKHLETIRADTMLALALLNSGKTKNAIPVATRNAEALKITCGDRDERTLTARWFLLLTHFHSGNIESALSIGESLLVDLAEVRGVASHSALQTRGLLILAHRKTENAARASELLNEGLAALSSDDASEKWRELLTAAFDVQTSTNARRGLNLRRFRLKNRMKEAYGPDVYASDDHKPHIENADFVAAHEPDQSHPA